jgi:hypothetical protein
MNLSSILPEGELLRQIAERSLSVFFLYNLHTGRFEYVSPAFEEIWGRQEGSINEQLDWLLSTVFLKAASARPLPALPKT